MEPVTIVVTTYFPPGEGGALRAQVARQAIHSWNQLLYAGSIRVHFADDGSAPEHDGWRWDSRQERHGVGASLNAGFRAAFEHSPLVLYAVDDWRLDSEIDITPWAELLLQRDDIGMVRLGPPHPDLTGRVEHLGPLGWALHLDRHHFAFGHRPALYHRRMIEAYGWFDEDVNAYDCERLYNERFCAGTRPGIVLALPSPWTPLESIELADVDPRAGAE